MTFGAKQIYYWSMVTLPDNDDVAGKRAEMENTLKECSPTLRPRFFNKTKANVQIIEHFGFGQDPVSYKAQIPFLLANTVT